MSLAPIIGSHAKKQNEDLSDNDGDEDEGIFHGEQRRCMISSEVVTVFKSFWFSHLCFNF